MSPRSSLLLGSIFVAASIVSCASGGEPTPPDTTSSTTTSGSTTGTAGHGGTGGSAGGTTTSSTGGNTGSGGTTATGGSGGASTGGAGGTTTGTGGSGGGTILGPCGQPTCTGDVEWVRRYGPAAGQQFSYGMGVDFAGNATIAGSFNGTLDLQQMTLTTAGGIDMFWARVDKTGVTTDARRFGGAGNDVAVGAAVDRKGNTAYYGLFSGTLDFGNGPLSATNFRMFLARLDPNGTAVWSKAFGDQVNASSQTAAFDQNGNVIYSAGYFGDIDFGLGPVTGGSSSITITKFTGAGVPVWGKKLSTAMASAVAVDGAGGIVIAGSGDATSPPDIGCGSPGAFRFVGRLDANGSCLWQKAVVGPAIDMVAAEGNVIALLGRFNASGTIGADTLSAPGGKRFIALYDLNGTLIGSFIVTDANVTLDTIAVDTHGGVVVKGTFMNGGGDVGGNALTGDSFLARLGPDAAWVWGKGLVGDAGFPVSTAVATSGHVYLYGRASGPVDFGSGILGGGAVPNEDVVLARFKP